MTDDIDTPPHTPGTHQLLACVLDELIPPQLSARLPGAGALGLADRVATAVAHTPPLHAMIVHGLMDLDAAAHSRHGRGFTALAGPERVALLHEQGFVLPLCLYAYIAYYEHPQVVAALGLEPRPPHPQGYELAAGDLTLLDQVRARPALYRSSSS